MRLYANFIAVGPCYIDTILSVPTFPAEDAKLRATRRIRRRGGNTLNVLEVLQQFLHHEAAIRGTLPTNSNGMDGPADTCYRRVPYDTKLYTISAMPENGSADGWLIRKSFEDDPEIQGWVDLDHCAWRPGRLDAPASYIIASSQTASRTVVNFSDLDALSRDEYVGGVRTIDFCHGLGMDHSTNAHFHFEVRDIDLVRLCSDIQRHIYHNVTISAEVEKPGAPNLASICSYVDFVFFSKSWAMNAGYEDASSCIQGEISKCVADRRVRAVFCTWGADGATGCLIRESSDLNFASAPAWIPPMMNGTIDSRSPIVDTTGAGDTWTAAILYSLLYMRNDNISGNLAEILTFANEAAGRKIRRWGFSNIGNEMRHYL